MPKPNVDLFLKKLPKVEVNINKYAKTLDDEVAEKPDNINIVMQTLGIHLSKLGMLESIMEGKFIENTLPVTITHYEKAKGFVDQVIENYYEVISKLGRKKDALRTQEEPLERIYRLIASAGVEGIKQSDLLKKSRMTSEKLEPLLKTLIATKDVVKVQEKSTGGRRAVVLKATRAEK